MLHCFRGKCYCRNKNRVSLSNTAILLLAAACCSLWVELNHLAADEIGASAPSTAEAVFGQGVRETPHLTPEQEKAGFHLPDGFVVDLIASEPQIQKPLNMAFDAQGKLWITDTIEYPYPAAPDAKSRDTIKVLEDKDGDGTFESITTFADGLNIPIGILPIQSGVICFSIPNLWLLKDNDGDGKCDERKLLLGPFDTSRDTHGMINALRQGADGWIYACHGFNNQSHVKAADGSEIHLQSGNTFRFRPDGSHVEQFTTGQVNPFGMTHDEWGNLYTADCHSKPVTLLVRHGYYESFGRPDAGLGFVPSLMKHLHGSTAICGIQYYQADHFPDAFRSKLYSGNVMTSRINCNRLIVDRNSITLQEEPDFMSSDDPWFRPVDIQLGLDGALYVADFYNKIIGHYEVRLDHPERDRTSGRIWRIRYSKNPLSTKNVPVSQNAWLSDAHLRELNIPNVTRRDFAVQSLILGSKEQPSIAAEQLTKMVLASDNPTNIRIAALWGLHSLKRDDLGLLAAIQSQDKQDPLITNALFQAWEDRPRVPVEKLTNEEHRKSYRLLQQAARTCLQSDHPQLALSATRALAEQGDDNDIAPLLSEIAKRPSQGSVVQHAMRIAVANLLKEPSIASAVLAKWSSGTLGQSNAPKELEAVNTALANILPAVDSEASSTALLRYTLSRTDIENNLLQSTLKLACKHLSSETSDAMVKLLKRIEPTQDEIAAQWNAPTMDQQLLLAIEAVQTLQTSKQSAPPALIELINQRVNSLSRTIEQKLSSANQTVAVSWSDAKGKAWPMQERARRGSAGQKFSFMSSHALGETYTGTLRSSEFSCPASLSFWLVGHDGPPNAEPQKLVSVRLIDSSTNTTIETAVPPRSDTAIRITWNLQQYQSRTVRFECVDQDSGTAYAWLGVGGFSLDALNVESPDAAISKLTRLLDLKLAPQASAIVDRLLSSKSLTPTARVKLIACRLGLEERTLDRQLAETADARGQSVLVSEQLLDSNSPARMELATKLALLLNLQQQTFWVRTLVGSPDGRQLVLELVTSGKVSEQSLRGLKEVLGNLNNDEVAVTLMKLSEAASAQPNPTESAIADRIKGYKLTSRDTEKGRVVYEKNCASCHKLKGAGQLIAPQLDGVAARGAERLAEDVLLPNRNVDKAFRMSSLLLEDDRVVVGLVRDANDGMILVVGPDGKTQTISSKDVVNRVDTTRSLMPDNFSDLLTEQDLSNLLNYIMH